jgi:D-alanyl-D-alanine carboxypeptidase
MPAIERVSQLRVLLILWFMILSIGFFGALLQFSATLSSVKQVTFDTSNEPVLVQNQYRLATPSAQPKVSAGAVWIYDRNSHEVLYSLHENTATAPASLVKMMTALVAFENLDLNAVVRVGSASAVAGNRAKFRPTDQFSVRDLFKAMLVFSANDAGQALANAGSPSGNFVDLMNKKALDLHLAHSFFTNPTGLDDPQQYSCAADLGQIAITLLENPFLETTVSEQLATISERQTGRKDMVYTTNNLLHQGPEFLGIKTGTTDQAGQNLVFRYKNTWKIPQSESPTQLQTRNFDLVVVILGSQDRYADALSLLDWLERSLQIEKSSLR